MTYTSCLQKEISRDERLAVSIKIYSERRHSTTEVHRDSCYESTVRHFRLSKRFNRRSYFVVFSIAVYIIFSYKKKKTKRTTNKRENWKKFEYLYRITTKIPTDSNEKYKRENGGRVNRETSAVLVLARVINLARGLARNRYSDDIMFRNAGGKRLKSNAILRRVR